MLNVWVAPLDGSGAGPRGDPRPRPRRAHLPVLPRRPAPALPAGHRRRRELAGVPARRGRTARRRRAVEPRLVTPGDGIQARIAGHNRWNPTTVLIALNDRVAQLHDVHALDLATGELTPGRREPRVRRLADRPRPGGARRHDDGRGRRRPRCTCASLPAATTPPVRRRVPALPDLRPGGLGEQRRARLHAQRRPAGAEQRRGERHPAGAARPGHRRAARCSRRRQVRRRRGLAAPGDA